MFSPLAKGVASWDGGVKLDQKPQELYSDELLLPQILLKSCQQTKSVKSLDSSVAYNDGQLLLPKTFVTRKGALLLFTPSEELLPTEDETPPPPPNVYEDGLKLKTVGNLINSVLQFGKEEEQAWEGIPGTPPSKDNRNTNAHHQGKQTVRDRKAFLRFLHYLDSECLTADKHAQPGCDPDFYLDELRSSSRFGSNRRSGSQTPYSCRKYDSLLDDDNLSDIVQEYIRWNRRHQREEKTMADDIDEDFQEQTDYEGYGASTGYLSKSYSSPPNPTSLAYSHPQSFYYPDDALRPRTAPLPPAPESPRANPRITSGRRPPPKRALGSTPDHIDDILRADVMPGRNVRRGPSPRLKFSRNTSPAFYPSSRGETPEYGCTSRFETPAGLSENWSRAEDLIEEAEESSQGSYTRPVSAVSFRSRDQPDGKPSGTAGKNEDIEVQHRRTHSFYSRSESMSSVSNQHGPRSMSGRSRAHTRSLSRSSHVDELESEEERAPVSMQYDDPGMLIAPPPSARMPNESVSSTSREMSTHELHNDPISAACNEPSSMTSPTRHDEVMSRDLSSRGSASRRNSSKMSQRTKYNEVLLVDYNFQGRKISLRSKSASNRRHLDETTSSRNLSRKELRPFSAPISIPGDETNVTLATLGSEANIDDVIEVVSRHQSFVDIERDLDSPDVAWPVDVQEGLVASDDDSGGYGSAAEEVNIELPPSPSLAGSGFFRLNATWSPVDPPDQPKEQEDRLDAQPPSETGATGVQSRSPTPTQIPDMRPSVTAVISLDNEDEDDVDSMSADATNQWPPQAPQKSPTPITTATPVLQTEVTERNEIENISRRSVSPSIYQETIDIKRSRPSTPVNELERQQPVLVEESVIKYLETGHEPQERPRSGRKLKGLDREPQENLSEPVSEPVKPVDEPVKSVEKQVKPDETQNIAKGKKPAKQAKQEKPVSKPTKTIEKVVEISTGISSKTEKTNVNTIDKLNQQGPKAAEQIHGFSKSVSSAQQPEPRKDYINIVLNKPIPPAQLDQVSSQGVGKESDGLSSVSSVSAAPTAPTASFVFSELETPKREKETPRKPEEPAKNDLSDLAALISRNKSAKVAKEKKEAKKKTKAAKAAKAAKKNEIKVDPNNIEFDAFNTPEMLEHMDDELKQFIQQKGNTEEPLTEETQEATSSKEHVSVPQIAPPVPPEMKNAYTPSKPKKPSKQELAKKRGEARKAEKKRKDEEKKRKEEEKRIREEELRILKEKEDEQERAREEAELKQQAIEEEKARRLEEEENARREEEEAMEKLKDAKKKAREEREQRRAAEAERRKLEVQRKREEKKKREEEMKEKEKEMERMKMDQEKRKQELMEARKRQEELERQEEERRLEEERLRALEEEEEQRRLEEEQIRQAEEELRRLQEEREYKEQMRRIAEARERKLREQEEERLRQEEDERRAIQEQRRRLEEEEEKKVQEQKKRLEMAKRLEAVARMRKAHEAARRKTMLLKRREDNIDRMTHLKSVRQDQNVTRSHTFTYYVRVPRQVWELPIGFGKQKKGFRGVKKKPAKKT